MKKSPSSLTRELFRYAKLQPPRIFDLNKRLSSFRAGKSLLRKEGREKVKAAKDILAAKDFTDARLEIEQRYLSPLKKLDLPLDRLPGKKSIQDITAFSVLSNKKEQHQKDGRKVAQYLYAAIVLNRQTLVKELNGLLQLIEGYAQMASRTKSRNIAPVVTRRFDPKAKAAAGPPAHPLDLDNASLAKSLSSKDVLKLWRATNSYRQKMEQALETKIEASRKKRSEPIVIIGKGAKQKRGASHSSTQAARQLLRQERVMKRLRIKEERKNLQELRAQDAIHFLPLMLKESEFRKAHPDLAERADHHMAVNNMVNSKNEKLCEWFAEIRKEEDGAAADNSECNAPRIDPCLRSIASDWHSLRGRDQIRALGEAELITVEEKWLGYSTGEISAVETVMKNERRSKTVDTEKVFEQTIEHFTEEVSESESETESTTQNELSSQIETELQTQFSSDINSSVSGSAGGSIGVVDFNGEGSLGADVSVGLDTSVSTSDSSNFSNEIVSRALEKTKKTTRERRVSRTYRKFANSYTHEINNTGAGSDHINGIYTYLDKHIRITEKRYGIRQFLIADVLLPGRDLIQHEMQRQTIRLTDSDIPPEFNIGPSDILVNNYLSLVGRYRASHVSTPPPIIKQISRTYKTDTSNENRVQEESKIKQVVDVLVPFFGKYKRFLIQDQIEIPEGYRVYEVQVTVTHGSNGISIPAHLPFTLTGALIYALPKLAVSAIPTYALFYLPIALAEIMYLASPVLHYNADSSNVTINIGHETKESPYFFFQPEELLTTFADIVSGFGDFSEGIIASVRARLEEFFVNTPSLVNADFASGVSGPINAIVGKIGDLLDVLKILAKPWTSANPLSFAFSDGDAKTLKKFMTGGFQDILDALNDASFDFQSFFQPFQTLLNELVDLIGNDLLESFKEALQDLLAQFENSDHRLFSNVHAMTGTLPISLNCVALKPGITVNLTACLVRIDDQALDSWRMETFDRLYQAYFQLQAEYESKLMQERRRSHQLAHPRRMRVEERTVIKSRIFKSLKSLHGPLNATPHLEEYKLFEHSIDWSNLSYRLYNYEPKGAELVMEKLGLYKHADWSRQRFMKALWAQVLIPLKEDELLESQMMAYIQSGEVTTLDSLIAADTSPDNNIDEIAAIYQDVILRRNSLSEPTIIGTREEVVPTDFIAIYAGSENLDFPKNSSLPNE